MKNINVTPLVNNDLYYKRKVDTLEEKYKCEWDDKIHDTYRRYVLQMKEHSEQLKSIRCKTEILASQLENLDLDEIREKAEALCREADNI